jgi:arylsulfatase A-like enzyme
VPFIVRWPGRIEPGTSAALVSHVDMLASLAAITGQTLAEADGPDSLNVMPALLGEPTGRTHLVEQGPRLALREGTWKYLPPTADSAAKPSQKAAVKKNTKPKQAGKSEPAELYDLAADIGETQNVAARYPDVVDRMQSVLEDIQSKGRTRP